MANEQVQTPATPAAAPLAPAAVAPPATSPVAAAPVEQPVAAAKPEGFDDYWDDTAKALKFDALKTDLSALKELKTFKAEHDIRLQGVPAKAEDYVIDLSAVKIPEGVDLKPLDKSDPFVQTMLPLLHKSQLGQEAVNELASAYAQHQIKQAQDWNTAMTAERAKLGDKSQERIDAVQTALLGRLGEKGKALVGAMVSASVIEGFEALLRTTAAAGPGASPNGVKPKADMTGLSTQAKFATIYAQNEAVRTARKSN